MKKFFNQLVYEIKHLISYKSLKYGSNSIILIAAVVAIAVVVNMIFGMFPLKWDLTANKMYSITDTTKKIIEGLDRDITIYALFDEGTVENNDYLKQVDELLQKYNSKRVSVQYIDPDRNPTIIQEIDPDNVMALRKTDYIVVSDIRKKKISYDNLFQTNTDNYGQTSVTGVDAEQYFTGAIKYVLSDSTPVIYFVEGHDERRIETEFTMLKSQLEKNNYDVAYFNILTAETLPADAEAIVFAAPKADLTLPERERVKEFLDVGADMIFMFDSLSSDTKFPMFENILSNYNITLNYDRIMENESSRYVPGNQYYFAPYFQAAGFSASLASANFPMIMSSARSVNILKNVKEYLTVTSLAKTSAKAAGKPISGGSDLAGPLDVIVTAEYTGTLKPTRLLVMGSSTFVTDAIINGYTQNGLAYFLVAMNWMSDKTDDLYIAPKTYDKRSIDLSQLQATVSGVIVTGVIPILILGLGLIIWSRRRHL